MTSNVSSGTLGLLTYSLTSFVYATILVAHSILLVRFFYNVKLMMIYIL